MPCAVRVSGTVLNTLPGFVSVKPFLVAQTVKDPPAMQETWVGKIPGEGNGNPLRIQYSCLENSMDIGAWWATVHRVAKSWT